MDLTSFPRWHGRSQSGSRVVLAVALALSSGCRAGADAPASYQLRAGDGAPLPLVLNADSCVTHLVNGTLALENQDMYTARYQIRKICLQQTDSLPDPGVRGRYRISGDSIHFLDPDGKSTGAGLFSRDSIVVRGPEHTLTFQRDSIPR